MADFEKLWNELRKHLVEQIRHPNEYIDDIGAIMQMRFILRKMEEMEETEETC